MRRGPGEWVSPWALAAALSCDPQVGDEYTGEPLLSLQGNVLLTEEQTNINLVPQLAFRTDELVVLLVQGEVSGDFPAKFRFDVMEPPPAASIHTELVEALGVEVGIAVASLVMLPADHGREISAFFDTIELDRECLEDDSVCTHTERECDAAGSCRERDVECRDEPCTLLERLEAGSSHAGEPAHSYDYKCDAEACYLVESSCDAAGACFADVYHCAPGRYYEYVRRDGGWMTTCDVLAERGDRWLASYGELNTVAIDYEIHYLTIDLPQYGLERGYNLVLNPRQSAEEWLEQEQCELSTTAEVVAQYNAAHGTEYHPFSLDGEVEDLAVVAWEEECDQDLRKVVERPFDELLTLKLGDPDLDSD